MPVPILSAPNAALVGYTISREDAPWGDPAWDVSICNNLHLFLRPEQKFHRAYDLHDKLTVESDAPHVEWLKQSTVPVYMQPEAIRPEYPTAVPFPLATMDRLYRDEFGLFGWRYYTNSVSYMIALTIAALLPAIKRGERPTLGLWGIDMAVGGSGQAAEYSGQRPSCEYWLGVAEGLGIKVFIAERADLLKCGFRYGEEHSDFVTKIRSRSRELEQRIAAEQNAKAQIENELSQRYAMINQLTGALESNRYVEAVWLPPETAQRHGADDPSMAESQQAL